MKQKRLFLVRYVTLVVAVLVASIGAVDAGGQEASLLLEPFPIRDGFLLNQGFLQPSVESAVRSDETWEVDVVTSSSNSFAKSIPTTEARKGGETELGLRTRSHDGVEPEFFVDGESLSTVLRLSRRLGSFELNLNVPLLTYGGGWSDPVIEDFHEQFGLGNNQREEYAQNAYRIRLPGTEIDGITELHGSEIGDVTIGAKWSRRLEDDGSSWWGVVGLLDLPTGDQTTLRGSGSLDGAIGLLVSKTGERFGGHAALHLTAVGANESLATPSQIMPSGGFTVGWLASSRTALLLQGTVWLSPLRELPFEALGEPIRQVTVGLRHAVTRHSQIHLAIGENVKAYENSSDLVVQIGISLF